MKTSGNQEYSAFFVFNITIGRGSVNLYIFPNSQGTFKKLSKRGSNNSVPYALKMAKNCFKTPKL